MSEEKPKYYQSDFVVRLLCVLDYFLAITKLPISTSHSYIYQILVNSVSVLVRERICLKELLLVFAGQNRQR